MQHKSSYFWGVISRFAPQGLYMITTMVLARYLSPDDFGTIGVLSVIFMVANTLIDSGLGGSLIKEKEITSIDCSTISTFNIFISSLIYIIIFLSAPFIEEYYAVKDLALITRLVSLEFVIGSLGLVPRSLLVRELRFRDITIASILIVVIASTAAIIAALLKLGVFSLVIYRLTHSITRVVFQYYLTKFHFSLRFSYDSFRKLISFGLFTTICSVIDTVYENLLTIITGKYMNVKEAGYMYQSKQLETVLSSSVAATIASVSFPILTRYKEDINEFRKEARSIFQTVSIVVFPILVSIAFFSKPIIRLLYGSQWDKSAFYLSWLLIAGILHIMENLNRTFIKSHADVDKLTIITIIKRTIGIGIIFISLTISPEAIVFGYIVSTLFGFLCNQYLYCKIISDNFIKSPVRLFNLLLPIFVYSALLLFFKYGISGDLWLNLAVSIILLFIYYFLIAPKYGVSIISLIKGLVHK